MSKWISKWYEISAERGHSDVVPFYYFNASNEKTDLSFRHRDMDATGRMAKFLDTTPKLKAGLPPSSGTKLKGLFRKLYRPIRPAWKAFDASVTTKRDLSWIELDETETLSLETFCQREGISVNMFLMEKLSKILFQDLMATDHLGGSWLFPVNMRGWIDDKKTDSNCVSYIPLTVHPGTSAKDLHQEMKSRLSGHEHWTNWLHYHVGIIVGYKGMKRLSRKASEKQFWLGSFSDLGDWTQEAPSALEGRFVFCPPGSPNFPVSVGLVKFRGRRTIGLKIHPALGDEVLADKILRSLVARD